MRILQCPKIPGQSLKNRLRLLTEFFPDQQSDVVNRLLSVNLLPDETSVFLQADTAYPGLVKELLRQPVIETLIGDPDLHQSLFVYLPREIGRMNRNVVQIILILLTHFNPHSAGATRRRDRNVIFRFT